MTESVVKDAKAKRDAAQAELDKAVSDTKDEIQKASDAVKEAAPDKETGGPAITVTSTTSPPVVFGNTFTSSTTHIPIKPIPVTIPATIAPASHPSILPRVLIALAIVAAAVGAYLHFVQKAF